MIYGSMEYKRVAMQERAEGLRLAASQVNKVKEVVKRFDGKIYNCRFDEAIAALTDDESRFYCSNQYGWFHIQYSRRNGFNQTLPLLTAYSCKSNDYIDHQTRPEYVVFDGKRIKADAMVDKLNAGREALLKEAYEIEDALDRMDDTLKQIEALKSAMNEIISSIPSAVADAYGLKRVYCL